jgi:hypothetical protein
MIAHDDTTAHWHDGTLEGIGLDLGMFFLYVFLYSYLYMQHR